MQDKTRIDYSYETIVSWYIEGVNTVEELESKYTNYEIKITANVLVVKILGINYDY
jgi:hypothetical protein